MGTYRLSRSAAERSPICRALLALLVGVLLVAGCTGSDDEGFEDVSDTTSGGGTDSGGETDAVEEDSDLTGGEVILRDFSFPLPLFSAASEWNQSAIDAPVSADSDEQILATYRQLVGDVSQLVPADEELPWPFVVVNYDAFSYPVFLAGDGIDDVVIRDYDGELWFPSPTFTEADGEGGPVPLPSPAGRVRPAGPAGADSDGHAVLYDPTTNKVYDFWQATTVLDESGESLGGGQTGGTILEAGAVEMFDLAGPGMNPPGQSSARATGTAMLAGLLIPEDVESGAIAHALAFALPGPRNLSDDPSEPLDSDWAPPASTTETDYYSTDPAALAAGQRIRLRDDIVDDEGNLLDEAEFAPVTAIFVSALRDYGAYLVDGSGGFTFYAEDIHTANLMLSDGEVNQLIGRPEDSALPSDKTKWQIVMEVLSEDLERIPIASGPWSDYGPGGEDPSTATFETSNFEVVE